MLHFITNSLLHLSSNLETSNSSLIQRSTSTTRTHRYKHTHAHTQKQTHTRARTFSLLDGLQSRSLEPRLVPRLPFDTHKHTYANDPTGFSLNCASRLKGLNTDGNFISIKQWRETFFGPQHCGYTHSKLHVQRRRQTHDPRK